MRKRRKPRSENVIKFTVASLVTTALVTGGVAIYDENIEHTEELCPLLPILGYQHQINRINHDEDNKLNGISAYYQEEIEYSVHTITVYDMEEDGSIMLSDNKKEVESHYIPEAIVVEKQDENDNKELVKVLVLKR